MLGLWPMTHTPVMMGQRVSQRCQECVGGTHATAWLYLCALELCLWRAISVFALSALGTQRVFTLGSSTRLTLVTSNRSEVMDLNYIGDMTVS